MVGVEGYGYVGGCRRRPLGLRVHARQARCSRPYTLQDFLCEAICCLRRRAASQGYHPSSQGISPPIAQMAQSAGFAPSPRRRARTACTSRSASASSAASCASSRLRSFSVWRGGTAESASEAVQQGIEQRARFERGARTLSSISWMRSNRTKSRSASRSFSSSVMVGSCIGAEGSASSAVIGLMCALREAGAGCASDVVDEGETAGTERLEGAEKPLVSKKPAELP
jgi:hypothetical protein